MLFIEVAFLDRFEAASTAGFKGVEYVSPYEHPAEIIAEKLAANDLKQVLFNLPVGDWSAGERGIAIFPEREQEFRNGVATAIRYAKALGCEQVNCLAGIAPSGVDASTLEATLVKNLRFAAAELARENICLLIEPVNTRDMPGFFVNTSKQALDIIDRVGSDNLFLQYDIYHMQVMEGDVAATLARFLPRIRHVQIADNPGRHEPGTGDIDFPFLFDHLDRLGYAGWVGAEYKPATTTTNGLGWFTAAGA